MGPGKSSSQGLEACINPMRLHQLLQQFLQLSLAALACCTSIAASRVLGQGSPLSRG